MKHKATICQVLHSLQVGGAEVLAARLARQLRDKHRFIFVCLDELGSLGHQLKEEGFAVEVLRRRPGLDWRSALFLAGWLRRQNVDLLHAHQYTPFFYSALARLVYRRPGILFSEHGRHHPDYPRRKRIVANRVLLTRRDRVVGVGEAVRQALIRNEGISPERVRVIYNGIDLQSFANGVADRWEVRNELGLREHDLAILQVARLDYLKDHATGIRALERVLVLRPGAKLILAGEGPELGKIQTLVRQRNLESSVRFLGLRKDVARLLRAADLFLLTSISEGIPLTLIEAMAAGLPIVSTKVGGVPEVVEDGRTGCLAPAGDDALLAEKILHLAGDHSLRARMGQSGLERARAIFSESEMHAQYDQLYREMLKG
jgi:L-malate glycosyltransferase